MHHATPSDSRIDPLGFQIILALLVLCGFILRFAWLDVPALMHDEALACLVAEQSPLYIILRAIGTDAHPPYFYFLVKLCMVLGQSDFALRLLPAACGVLAVPAVYGLARRLTTKETAILAAALMACYFLHIQVSRTIRPHPFIVLCTTVSLSFLLDYCAAPSLRRLAKLAGVNLVMLLLHFNTLLVLGAEMALVMVLLPGAWKTGPRRAYLAFLGIAAASMLVNLPMFLWRLGKFPGFALNTSMAWTFGRTLDNLGRMLAVGPVPLAALFGGIAFAAGLWRLARHNRFAALVLLSSIFLPLAALIAARYGIYYEPWHISFIIPALVIVMAHGLAGCFKRPLPAALAALILTAAGTVAILVGCRDSLYAPTVSMLGQKESSKEAARELPRSFAAPALVLANDVSTLGFVNWYLRQFSTLDLTQNGFGPDDAGLSVALLHTGQIYADSDRPEEVARLADRLLADFGPPVDVRQIVFQTLRRWRYARSPSLPLGPLPAKAVLTAYAPDFLRHAREARDFAIALSPLAHAVYPAAFDRPATAVARFAGEAGAVPPADLTVEIQLTNETPLNTFEVFYSFDDAPPIRAGSVMETGNLTARLRLHRDTPFRTLDIRCVMAASSRFPTFYAASDTVRLDRIMLTAEPLPPSRFTANVPVVAEGFSPLETVPEGCYRWGMGPRSALRFALAAPGPVRLGLSLQNPIPGQGVTVTANGTPVGRLDALAASPWLTDAASLDLTLDGRAGENTVSLAYDHWNGQSPDIPAANFAPGDGRPLAVAVTRLTLDAPRSETPPALWQVRGR